MAGPGAISAAIVASSTFVSIEARILLSVCSLCLGVVTTLLLLFSAQIEKYLGVTGLNIISRIGGLILAALAVEIIFQGVEGFIHSFR
jgi:multiple antibiotic resistance protein